MQMNSRYAFIRNLTYRWKCERKTWDTICTREIRQSTLHNVTWKVVWNSSKLSLLEATNWSLFQANWEISAQTKTCKWNCQKLFYSICMVLNKIIVINWTVKNFLANFLTLSVIDEIFLLFLLSDKIKIKLQ